MKKWLPFALIALLLGSCSGNKEDDSVSLDELAPISERYKDGYKAEKQDSVKQVNARPEESLFLAIADTMLPDSYWVKWDTILFADRFGPKTSEKWIVTGKTDSLVFLQYTFKDSLKTKNAFFNWLDCFGPKCRPYRIGDNLRLPKRQGLILVGAKNLLFVEGNKPIDELLIRNLLEEKPEKQFWIYSIVIPKKGKTTWKRIVKGEEQPIIPGNENS